MQSEPRISLIDALALAIIAAASIVGINQYTYGLYNHFITIPFIKSIINPELYPHDYLVVEQKYLYTYFTSGCAWLVTRLHVSLPQLFFVLYCASLYASLVAFFKISLALFPKKEVAYFSVIFLIFSFTTLGEVRTIESLFLERTLVLPFQLFAFYFLLKKRVVLAFALAGISFLFHPLTAVYVLACFFLCTVFSLKEIGWKNFILSLVALAVIISPVLYLKALNPAPSLHLIHADAQWLELLRMRSSHHLFPTSWSALLIAQSALFIAGFGLCRIHKPAVWEHKVAMLSSAAVLLLCIAGTLFTEIFPVAIIIQFQLFRSFVFLIFFAFIYYANFFFEESKSRGNLFQKLLVFACFAGIFYSGNFSKYASFLLVALAIFPGYALAQAWLKSFAKFYLPAVISLVFALGLAGCMMKEGFTIKNRQKGDWLAIQAWAKKNTPADALFIVSPKSEGFRVESERAIYGDWKDGTQMFFNPAFGAEWFRRMNMLGFKDDDLLQQQYELLDEEDFLKIKSDVSGQYSTVYVVGTGKELSFVKVYQSREGIPVYLLP